MSNHNGGRLWVAELLDRADFPVRMIGKQVVRDYAARRLGVVLDPETLPAVIESIGERIPWLVEQLGDRRGAVWIYDPEIDLTWEVLSDGTQTPGVRRVMPGRSESTMDDAG